MTPAEVEPFDPYGPLPEGTTLLEASAGTGKTFTIAALTTRYVAERGVPVDRLLVITFTRMATGELRERVRERLVRAHDGLDQVIDGQGRPGEDELVDHLAAVGPDEQRLRRDRLAAAIAEFDAATIETTHGFCLQVLYGLGTAGDVDREVTLVEDVRDLLEEVVDDLYLRKFARRGNEVGFSRREALTIARKVIGHPDAIVVPSPAPAGTAHQAGDDPSLIKSRFAEAVRAQMEQRKRARRILTYDDVLLRLRATLRDPGRGPLARHQAARSLRRGAGRRVSGHRPGAVGDHAPGLRELRGPAGLTDHAAPHRRPQAGDLRLPRRRRAHLPRGQAVGRTPSGRSTPTGAATPPFSTAFDALFAGAQLGQAGISYRNVRPAPANVAPRLVGAPVAAPLRVRVVHAEDGLVPRTQGGQPARPEARELIARDVAATTVEMLHAAPELIARRHDGAEAGRRHLHPGDVAVLVRSNGQATTVRDALQEAGVPAVIGGAGSVFVSDAARRVAAPARGARAPHGARPRLARGPVGLRRLDRGRRGTRRGRRVGRSAPLPACVGPVPARPGGGLAPRDGQRAARRPGPGARPARR